MSVPSNLWASNDVMQRRLGDVAERLCAEYHGVFSPESVHAVVDDSVRRLLPITVAIHVPVLAERFARERLQAAAHTDGRRARQWPAVLFVCAHNAARSQLAAALTAHLSGGRVGVMSAGTDPLPEIDANVIAALEEIGIDVAEAFPKPLTDEVVRAADVVVTMGCGDACPVSPGPRYVDWAVPDPAGKDLDSVRAIRHAISDHVLDLLKELL